MSRGNIGGVLGTLKNRGAIEIVRYETYTVVDSDNLMASHMEPMPVEGIRSAKIHAFVVAGKENQMCLHCGAPEFHRDEIDCEDYWDRTTEQEGDDERATP